MNKKKKKERKGIYVYCSCLWTTVHRTSTTEAKTKDDRRATESESQVSQQAVRNVPIPVGQSTGSVWCKVVEKLYHYPNMSPRSLFNLRKERKPIHFNQLSEEWSHVSWSESSPSSAAAVYHYQSLLQSLLTHLRQAPHRLNKTWTTGQTEGNKRW